MEDGVRDGGAFDETVVFLRHFEDLPDPRQRGKVIYPLDEVLLLCLLAVLAGAEAIADIAAGVLNSHRRNRDAVLPPRYPAIS